MRLLKAAPDASTVQVQQVTQPGEALCTHFHPEPAFEEELFVIWDGEESPFVDHITREAILPLQNSRIHEKKRNNPEMLWHEDGVPKHDAFVNMDFKKGNMEPSWWHDKLIL